MPTKHSVRPDMWVIHGLVMAFTAGKSTPATREAHPPVALGEVPALALVGEWLADLNAQVLLDKSRVLQLPSCVHFSALVFGDLAPLADVLAQKVYALHHEILLLVALWTSAPLAVAWANVSDANGMCTTVATNGEVTPEQLHWVAIHPLDMRYGGAPTMAERWGHSETDFLLASRTLHLDAAWLCALAFRLQVHRLPTSAADNL